MLLFEHAKPSLDQIGRSLSLCANRRWMQKHHLGALTCGKDADVSSVVDVIRVFWRELAHDVNRVVPSLRQV